jgi:hypothetical protein
MRSWTVWDGVRLLIVDGYADLDPGGRPGLGAHACAEFGVPVIGVAKTAFRPATHAVPVVRGERSARPLFVTAAGCPAIRPQTWSATWQAATGYPTLFAAPTLWPAATRPDPDALATDMLIAADPDSSAMLRTGSAVTPIQTAAPGAC